MIDQGKHPTDCSTPQHPPLPMLVTGIAGVPGYNAFHYFRRRFGDQVMGVRQPSMWPLRGDGILSCEVQDSAAVRRLWQKYRFASLVNCVGSCRLKSCELDPAMAHRVNVLGTQNMMQSARTHNARVIHLSIDLVFSGRDHGSYVESDATDPVTVYGATMVRAEKEVQRIKPDSCILRISLPMGISFNSHAGAVDWIASRFRQSKPATLYFDEVRTPTYTDCLNGLFAKLLVAPLSGIFHAGGPRRLSLYEIAQIVNVVGGYDPDLLRGCARREAGPIPPRAGNVTLNSSKLIDSLGYAPFDPWPLEDALVPDGTQWHRQRSEQECGSEADVRRLLYCNLTKGGRVPPSRNQLWGNRRFNAR